MREAPGLVSIGAASGLYCPACNKILQTVFPLINFEMGHREGSVASILLRVRGLMFHSVAVPRHV